MTYEWTDLAFQQIDAGDAALFVFPLCVLFVFLVLAAQYESFSLPLAIILIVPMALLAGLVGIYLQGGDNNIFTQIGFLVLVGLASKNAILIVEFAKHLQEQGRDRVSAVLEAARLRLRPIVMTSIAFIMGVLPLVHRHRRRRRSASRHGRGGVLGNDRRDRVRSDADARVLCVVAPGADQGRCRRSSKRFLLMRKTRFCQRHSRGRGILAACAVGPNYHAPETKAAEKFDNLEATYSTDRTRAVAARSGRPSPTPSSTSWSNEALAVEPRPAHRA